MIQLPKPDLKSTRVLWAVNHKTLIRSEPELLRSLGYEVYIPKKLPDSGFRSGATSYTHDESLSIPKEVLLLLNEHNFFKDKWNAEIEYAINEYFDVIFVIHWPTLLLESALKFKGKILFRVYGLQNNLTYGDFILNSGGYFLKDLFANRQRDLILAAGYEQVIEAEPGWLTRNNIYLPITIPDNLWNFSGTHNRNSNKVLFLCSNRLTSEYYANQAEKFRSVVHPNPYTIVDGEDPDNGDPNVMSKISFEELIAQFQGSAAFYTPSEELRTTLYSPVEASIIGCPVVYHKNSLLGRITPNISLGKVSSPDQATNVIERICNNDLGFTNELLAEQESMGDFFKISQCVKTWQQNFNSLVTNSKNNEISELEKIIIRQSVDKNSSGKLTINFFEFSPTPSFVKNISGISWPEFFGRWTDSKIARIDFVQSLPKKFKIKIIFSTLDENVNKKIKFSSSGRSKKIKIRSSSLQEHTFQINNHRELNSLFIELNNPIKLPNDSRKLGIAIKSIEIEKI